MSNKSLLLICGLAMVEGSKAQTPVSIVTMPPVSFYGIPVVHVEQPIEIAPAQVTVTNFPSPEADIDSPPKELFETGKTYLYWTDVGAVRAVADVTVLDRRGTWVLCERTSCSGGSKQVIWLTTSCQSGVWSIGKCR